MEEREPPVICTDGPILCARGHSAQGMKLLAVFGRSRGRLISWTGGLMMMMQHSMNRLRPRAPDVHEGKKVSISRRFSSYAFIAW
jgi:hypothetical protein